MKVNYPVGKKPTAPKKTAAKKAPAKKAATPKAVVTETPQEKYIREQKEWLERNNLEVGSLVALARIPKNVEARGWDENDADLADDINGAATVGDVGEIIWIGVGRDRWGYNQGIEVQFEDGEVTVPFFALRTVSKKIRRVGVTYDYSAIVTKKGLSFGGEGVSITWDVVRDLKKIHDTVEGFKVPQLKFPKLEKLDAPTFDFTFEDSPWEYISLNRYRFPDLSYDIEMDEEFLHVGCQEVKWSKIDELLDLYKEL